MVYRNPITFTNEDTFARIKAAADLRRKKVGKFIEYCVNKVIQTEEIVL